MSEPLHSTALATLHTQLIDARKRSRKIAQEIRYLKKEIQSLGGDPSGTQNLTERNIAIYAAFQSNIPVAEIAAQYNLSIYRVKELCKRITVQNSQVAITEKY